MRNLISILLFLLITITSAGCANTSGYSPGQQRDHAREAQGELSSEVQK